MINLKHILTTSILLLLFIPKIYSQQINQKEIDAQFQSGILLYDSGEYEQAYDVFDRIDNQPEYNSKTSASEFFKIKILLQLEKSSEAIQLSDSFLLKYLQSKYTDEVRMLLIQADINEEEYKDALIESVNLLLITKDENYKEEAKKTAELISYSYLTSSELQSIETESTEDAAKSFLLLQLGKLYLKEKDTFAAKSTFSDLMNKYPSSVEYEKARQLYQSAGNGGGEINPQDLIGVILPLTSKSMNYSVSTPGEEILDGIKFATSEFNKDRDDKIGLLIRDTFEDPDKIENIRSEFGSVPGIKAILGPIFSNAVRTALDEFNNTDIPIISPTATDDDLASLSENFFQANPSFSMRGKIMAQYIYYVENKRNVAILNSIDGYSPMLAANFADEFEKLGGSILTRQSYKSKGFDLKNQVDAINAYRDTLEGIYVPLSNSIDAPNILSQMVQDSLQIPIYGNQDWFIAKGFESSSELSNLITFTSDYYMDYKSEDFQELSKSYGKISGKDINRNFLYGYDAAKYILTIMRNINSSKINIRSKMLSGVVVTGYHNNTSFGEDRINHFLNIVRYKDGIFELVDKFRYGM
jgi:branched-chain amino acid transport system substrate-binding protein